MKIERLETHDRYKEFIKKDFSIADCVQDLINQRPFGNVPFYIFAHSRTEDDGVTKRMIWQPRLTKPKAQTNSMLFKAYPGSDNIKVIWMIPDRIMWKQYQLGNITENKVILESIHKFEHARTALEEKDPDDLSDERVDQIYREIGQQARQKAAQLGQNTKEII
jgi:hypothetical protein